MLNNLSRILKVGRCLGSGYFRKIFKLPKFSENKKTIKQLEREIKIVEIPKIIWIYWEEEELPKLVQGFINKIKKLHIDYDIHVLSKSNIMNYLPEFYCHVDVPIANKTDLIRLELLYKFGGIWMDATIILNEKVDWVYTPNLNARYDLVGFYREVNTIEDKYPVIETWFLASSAGNELIRDWLEVFKPIRDIGSVQYFEMLKKRDDYEIISARINPPDYLIVYLACQIVLRKDKEYSFYLYRAEDSAFFLQDYYKWNSNVISYVLTQLDSRNSNFKIIKLTSGDRNLLKDLEAFKLINKTSLIGQLLDFE